MLSERINRVQPSPTLAISAKAKALKAAGEDIISFSVGEPDFDTPEHIKKAAIEALQHGDTKYTAAAGTPDLRKTFCDKLARENGIQRQPEQVVVSVGGKHSLYNIFQCILNDGDEVIIPTPYWVSYPAQVLLADGKPVFIEAEAKNDLKITPQQLQECLESHPKIKAIVLNSPCNPTGAVYSEEALRGLCEVLENFPNVLVISDEVYEHMVYAPNKQWSVVHYSEEFAQRVILVHSLSKTYSMTGWRIGFTTAPTEIAKAIGKLQSQSTSNPTSFAQAGAIAALNGGLDDAMFEEFERRGRTMRGLLNDIPGFSCGAPEGAFYLFPDVSGVFGRTIDGVQINTATDLANYLLDKAKIACVPGEGFGAPNHIRFSYANSMENISEGVQRIADALAE